MRINPIQPLNGQFTEAVKSEMIAKFFYTNVGTFLHNIGYKKMSAYFKAESDSEQAHAQEILDFCADWGMIIPMPAMPFIETPQDVKSIFESAYSMEAGLYNDYCNYMNEAESIDRSAYSFFAKKVEDQRKSVAEYKDFLDQLDRYNGDFELEMFEDKYFD